MDGIPHDTFAPVVWRARVAYVTQARVRVSGTPLELFTRATHFKARRGEQTRDYVEIARNVGLEDELLNRPWSELSGGMFLILFGYIVVTNSNNRTKSTRYHSAHHCSRTTSSATR